MVSQGNLNDEFRKPLVWFYFQANNEDFIEN